MKELINIYKQESADAFLSIPTSDIEMFYNMVLLAYKTEKKIFACGNGGNVASVQNLVVDINMHPFVSEDKTKNIENRNKFHAVSLCDNSAVITGMTNDIGFENIFAEQLRFQANADDILFAMSGSGNSKNIVAALKMAKEMKMKTVLVTRNENTKAEEFADLVLRINGISVFPGNTGGNNNNFHYEDCISKIIHIIVGLLKYYVQNESRSK
jgi:D-sedoheptulose 7-phosphate isomerase